MSRAHSRAEGTRPRLRGPGGLAPGASTRWQAPAPALLPLLLIVAATTGCRGASQDSPLRAAAVDLSPRRDFSTPHTSPDAGALRQAPRSGRGGAQCDEIFVVSARARARALSPSLPRSLPPSLPPSPPTTLSRAWMLARERQAHRLTLSHVSRQGGLDYHLTPADVQCAFAQFGSVLEVQQSSRPLCARRASAPGRSWALDKIKRVISLSCLNV
jgi:hypothetical protein